MEDALGGAWETKDTGNIGETATCIYKKETIHEIWIFDHNLDDDFDIWIWLKKLLKSCHMPSVLIQGKSKHGKWKLTLGFWGIILNDLKYSEQIQNEECASRNSCSKWKALQSKTLGGVFLGNHCLLAGQTRTLHLKPYLMLWTVSKSKWWILSSPGSSYTSPVPWVA